MGWGNTNSDGESSQAPGSSQSTGGWGSSSYASQNSSPMSGGYRSDGGSSSGSGWGGQSTANPSITAQYGGGSSGSGNSSGSSSPMQSRVEAKVDAKNPANVTGAKKSASLTENGLAGDVAAPNANYWSGATDGWRNNTEYTSGKTVDYGSHEYNSNLNSIIDSGKANKQQIEDARAMIAGANAIKGREAAGGLTGTIGATVAGPIGGYALGKVGAWGAEKLSDLSTGYADNPAYNQAKKLASDDTSLPISVASRFSPVPGTSGMVKAVAGDYAGGFRQDMADLNRSMIRQGYIKSPTNIQRSGSSNGTSNSLLGNMMQTQQAAPSYDYSPAALDYGNFYSDMGSTI